MVPGLGVRCLSCFHVAIAACAEPAQLEVTGHPCPPCLPPPCLCPRPCPLKHVPLPRPETHSPKMRSALKNLPSPCSPGINFAISFQVPLPVYILGPKQSLQGGFRWSGAGQCSDWHGHDGQINFGSKHQAPLGSLWAPCHSWDLAIPRRPGRGLGLPEPRPEF